jgi:two-component sensor histidine kinase
VSEYAITLPALASMVGVARRAVVAILGDALVADDAVRIVSELATNAIVHAAARDGSAFVLTIVERQNMLRIAVDGPDAAPVWEGPYGDFGRGLVVVDALADRWGTDVHEDRITWWAEISRADLARTEVSRHVPGSEHSTSKNARPGNARPETAR